MHNRKIKACLFDMDGTLLNTEDIYTEAFTEMFSRFGKGPLTWDIKILLQGRPGPEASKIMIEKYNLPLTSDEFVKMAIEIQESKWHKTKFLPGALDLIEYLYNKDIPIALGTSSNSTNYHRKTKHLGDSFKYFGNNIVTGDDKRIPPGRGKPNPDIWYTCLDGINKEREQRGLSKILIEECLIFEDGIPGVISGIAAPAYVIWIPDVRALKVLDGKEYEIIGNGGEIILSLKDFDKAKFGL